MQKYKVLVTGGAGYIGSHTVKQLIGGGHEVFVIDNLSTGSKRLLLNDNFLQADIDDREKVESVLKSFSPDAVIHFAASKEAPESVLDPEKYYLNNVVGSLKLFESLRKFGVDNIIFSSTAAVYGDVQTSPITEGFETKPTNPYGETKLVLENALLDYSRAYGFKPLIFRYFNAGGADVDGRLGNLYPNSSDVISVVIKAASGRIKQFEIYGTDYETKDGTCIRDIIHVDDLARAHVAGLLKLMTEGKTGIYNLGSEQGYSIREIVATTKRVTGKEFDVIDGPRRSGDIVTSIASSKKAYEELGWKPKHGIEDIVRTAWEWHEKNI